MTFDRATAALNEPHLTWLEHRATGDLAILIKVVSPSALLVRYVTSDGGYHWTHGELFDERPDLVASREPAWLEQARISSRPSKTLYDLLYRLQLNGAREKLSALYR